MENIGALLDKLVYFAIGTYCLWASVKRKEKLGDKAALMRLCGIIFIIVGVVFTLVSIGR